MEDQEIISEIGTVLNFPTITSNIFLNLSLKQVLSYCQSNTTQIKICDKPYVWELYLKKHFNVEYNEYINQLLKELGITKDKDLVDFYYKRIEYMYLRENSPELADIKGIRRDGKDATNIQLKEHATGFMVTGIPGINYIDAKQGDDNFTPTLMAITKERDFKSFYQLVTFRASSFYLRHNLRGAIVRATSHYFNQGQEMMVPIEFMEAFKINTYSFTRDLIEPIEMLFGTEYYLNSLRKITDIETFEKKISFYIVETKSGIFRPIPSFLMFMKHFKGYAVRIYKWSDNPTIYDHEEFGKYWIEIKIQEKTTLKEALGNILLFFNLSLKYLGFTEEDILNTSILIEKFLKSIHIDIQYV